MIGTLADQGAPPAAPPLSDRGRERVKQEKERYPCEGCPYTRAEGCVGVCMRLILADWKKARRASARDAPQ